MQIQLFRSSFIAAVSFVFLAFAACTPSYINTENFGAVATAEQITAHYAGNSVKYANSPDEKPNIETFFGTDGTYKLVSLDDTVFAVGTWKVHTGVGPAKVILQVTQYVLDNGEIFSASDKQAFIVYIQPNGTAIVDQAGGRNFTQPKPTRGFQAERKWNSLMRQAGL